MRVEVVTAWPHQCESVVLELPTGATVADAAHASGLAATEQACAGFAIHGAKVKPIDLLSDGDRVELLRPLMVDPKTARRLRAQAQRERYTTRLLGTPLKSFFS